MKAKFWLTSPRWKDIESTSVAFLLILSIYLEIYWLLIFSVGDGVFRYWMICLVLRIGRPSRKWKVHQDIILQYAFPVERPNPCLSRLLFQGHFVKTIWSAARAVFVQYAIINATHCFHPFLHLLPIVWTTNNGIWLAATRCILSRVLMCCQTSITWLRSLSAILPLFWRHDIANISTFAAKTWEKLLWRHEIHDVFPAKLG